jgi:hypothetical protein
MPYFLGTCYTSDVLLDEMMHQAIWRWLGESGESEGTSGHNNLHWCNEINRIAPLLGFPHVKAKVVKQRRISPEEKAALEARAGKKCKTGLVWQAEAEYLERDSLARFPYCLRSPSPISPRTPGSGGGNAPCIGLAWLSLRAVRQAV